MYEIIHVICPFGYASRKVTLRTGLTLHLISDFFLHVNTLWNIMLMDYAFRYWTRFELWVILHTAGPGKRQSIFDLLKW